MQLVPMLPAHWEEVRKIYQDGILTGNATFEAHAPGWEQWNQSHLKHSRLVAIESSKVLGWAALSPVSGRCVYAGVAEVSVYVSEQARGKGIGKKLLAALIKESERNGLWTLQAGIFPENKSSIAIHLAAGFKIVGTREKIGRMNNIWRDTVLLERRSLVTGL